MQKQPITPEQLKAQFESRGETFADWARTNNYPVQRVYMVVNGLVKCKRGQVHEIAVKLGLKVAPDHQAAA